MRSIYYIPILHVPREFGSIQEVMIIQQMIGHYGEQKTKEFLEEIEQYWEEAEKRIQKADLNDPETASCLHIFVEGLPQVEENAIQEIVQKGIMQKIPFYCIIEKLLAAGAKIYGTEDEELLLEERRNTSANRPSDPRRAEEILGARDLFTAQRINAIVPEGEIGLLFIGRDHNVQLDGFQLINL